MGLSVHYSFIGTKPDEMFVKSEISKDSIYNWTEDFLNFGKVRTKTFKYRDIDYVRKSGVEQGILKGKNLSTSYKLNSVVITDDSGNKFEVFNTAIPEREYSETTYSYLGTQDTDLSRYIFTDLKFVKEMKKSGKSVILVNDDIICEIQEHISNLPWDDLLTMDSSIYKFISMYHVMKEKDFKCFLFLWY